MVRERGQLILIAAVLVATTIVGSVVLLNSVHSDANINAHKDGQSLLRAEEVSTQVQADLRALFYHHDSLEEAGEPLPYVSDRSTFADNVSAYSAQYMNLSALAGTGIVDVTVQKHREGIVVRQNESLPFDDGTGLSGTPWPAVQSAETIPYLSVNATTIDGSFFEMEISDGADSDVLRLTSVGGPNEGFVEDGAGQRVCGGPSASERLRGPIEIEIEDGDVEIRAANKLCTGIEFGSDLDAQLLEFTAPAGSIEGTYTVVGTGSGAGSGLDTTSSPNREVFGDPGTAFVNPTFEISYDDPSVDYEANVTLFGGNG